MILKKILLLHGAIGSRDQFTPLIEKLNDRFTVFSLHLEGHGSSDSSDRPFRIEHFAEGVIEWMDKFGHKKLDIFGYSMGGYVALYLALHYPDRVGDIFTLGTKFYWNREIAAKEAGRMNPEILEEKVPAFAEILKKRHGYPNDWKQVLHKTAEMIEALAHKPAIDSLMVKRISHRVRIAVGDRDEMVSVEESKRLAGSLENGEFMVLPNTAHPLEKVNIDRLASYLKEFAM